MHPCHIPGPHMDCDLELDSDTNSDPDSHVDPNQYPHEKVKLAHTVMSGVLKSDIADAVYIARSKKRLPILDYRA